jgi:hypothetical protein
MFKLLRVQRVAKEIPPDPNLDFQVIAYLDGVHADTEFFPDSVSCIRWARGRCHWAEKFQIFNDKWDHKLVGIVKGNGKQIEWTDQSLN